jgi:hypothetical protein
MKPSRAVVSNLARGAVLGLSLGAATAVSADVVLSPNPNPVKNLINVPLLGDPNAVNSVAFDNQGGIFVNTILSQGVQLKGVLTNSGADAVLHNGGKLLANDGGLIVKTLSASIVNDFLFQIGVDGRLANRDGGSITNNAEFSSTGRILNTGKAEFFNRGQAVLDPSFGGGFDNLLGASVVNTGGTALLDIGALFSNGLGARLRNENGAYMQSGALSNGSGADITNSNASFVNYGFLSNFSTLTNADAALFENIGQLANGLASTDTPTFRNQGGSRIINDALAQIVNATGGTFINDLASLVTNVGSFVNNGKILNAGGQFDVWDPADYGGPADPSAGVSGGGTFVQLAGNLVFNHGTMAQSMVDCQGGEITGIGHLNAMLRVSGGCTVGPGFSPGTLTLGGDLDFEGGTLAVQIAGLSAGLFDVLDVSGKAVFSGGTIEFSFEDGFVPNAGDRIPFLLADDLGGLDKVSFIARGLPGGLDLRLAAGANGLELLVGATPPSGAPEPQGLALVIAAVLAWRAASGNAGQRGCLLVARSRCPRTAASQTHNPKEVGPEVGRLWRSLKGGFGSPAVIRRTNLSPGPAR